MLLEDRVAAGEESYPKVQLVSVSWAFVYAISGGT